jgi:hypothetical protein
MLNVDGLGADGTAHWRRAFVIFTQLGVPEADEAREALPYEVSGLDHPASSATRA